MRTTKAFFFLAVLLIAGSISAYAEGAQEVIDIIRDASQPAPSGGGASAPTPAPSVGGPATWTAVSNSRFGTTEITAIAYGGNRFVAGGYEGKMAYADW